MTRLKKNKFSTPDNLTPTKLVCVTLQIPDDDIHISNFLGALHELSQGNSYPDDAAHTAKTLSRYWRNILLSLKFDDCNLPAPPNGGAEGGDETLIRQDPDNPCLLQSSIDGVNWCTFADFSKCLPAGSQPGNGTPQPPSGGGSACYQAEMPANNKWLVPTIVNSGDVLTLSAATGAGNDGTVAPWHCPDGNTFFAGLCTGTGGGLSGGDPLNTVYHMRLIYNINGTYYDAMAGAFTVPGGIVNAQVYVQVNDSVLSDNAGSYQFQVCRTNNSAVRYTHHFDLTLSPGPFDAWVTGGVTEGFWSAGVGWVDDGAPGPQVTIISNIVAPIDTISFVLNVTMAISGPDHSDILSGHVATTLHTQALSAGVQTVSWTGTLFTDFFTVSAYNNALSAGHLIISAVDVAGPGVDPF